MVSIAAANMTANFNKLLSEAKDGIERLALFDARAFNVPENDMVNAFLWRVKDWKRNSIQMYARSFFSHKDGGALAKLPRRFWSRVELVADSVWAPDIVKAKGLEAKVKSLRADWA